MSTIQLPGLLTGIDTKALIAQLMAVERRTLNMYEARKSLWEERSNVLSTLESKLSALRSAARALSDADELQAFTTATSDEDILTAEASYNAFEGSHTVQINQLATAERWVHTAGLEYAEDYTTEGTFIYSYNHKETVINTTTTTTLEDLVGLINNDADNPGVTASLLYYNDMYHLVLNGNDAGTDYEISINAYDTEVWQADSELTISGDNATLSTKIVDLDQFEGSLVSNEKIRIQGNQHDGTPIDVYMDVNDNTKLFHVIEEINDAFGGTATATLENGKIVLTDHECGTSQMTLTLSYDKGDGESNLDLPTISQLTVGGTVTADLTGFAEANFTETQSAQDSEIRVDGDPASDWIRRSSNTVDDAISGITLHLHDTGTAKVTLTRDVESVKEKLVSLVDAYNAAIGYIQEKTDYNEDNKTAGVLMGDYVVSTIRSQLLSPFVTQTSGFVVDIDSFLMPGQIGLEFDSDGVLSLDTNVFDEAIAEKYLHVLALIGADKTGSSTNKTIKFYGASSNYTTAGSYHVEVDVNDSDTITRAQIKLSTESELRDMTIDGNIVTGNSTFDENGYPVYPENGLQLSIDTSVEDNFTATVRVKQGFAGAIEDALDKILKITTGSIQIDQEHVDDTIEEIQERIDLEEYRLEKREARLINRFAVLERTLALLQNQMAALGFGTT